MLPSLLMVNIFTLQAIALEDMVALIFMYLKEKKTVNGEKLKI
jgi:hypothetical protein